MIGLNDDLRMSNKEMEDNARNRLLSLDSKSEFNSTKPVTNVNNPYDFSKNNNLSGWFINKNNNNRQATILPQEVKDRSSIKKSQSKPVFHVSTKIKSLVNSNNSSSLLNPCTVYEKNKGNETGELCQKPLKNSFSQNMQDQDGKTYYFKKKRGVLPKISINSIAENMHEENLLNLRDNVFGLRRFNPFGGIPGGGGCGGADITTVSVHSDYLLTSPNPAKKKCATKLNNPNVTTELKTPSSQSIGNNIQSHIRNKYGSLNFSLEHGPYFSTKNTSNKNQPSSGYLINKLNQTHNNNKTKKPDPSWDKESLSKNYEVSFNGDKIPIDQKPDIDYIKDPVYSRYKLSQTTDNFFSVDKSGQKISGKEQNSVKCLSNRDGKHAEKDKEVIERNIDSIHSMSPDFTGGQAVEANGCDWEKKTKKISIKTKNKYQKYIKDISAQNLSEDENNYITLREESPVKLIMEKNTKNYSKKDTRKNFLTNKRHTVDSERDPYKNSNNQLLSQNESLRKMTVECVRKNRIGVHGDRIDTSTKIELDKQSLNGDLGIFEEYGVKPSQKKLKRVYIPKNALKADNEPQLQKFKMATTDHNLHSVNRNEYHQILGMFDKSTTAKQSSSLRAQKNSLVGNRGKLDQGNVDYSTTYYNRNETKRMREMKMMLNHKTCQRLLGKYENMGASVKLPDDFKESRIGLVISNNIATKNALYMSNKDSNRKGYETSGLEISKMTIDAGVEDCNQYVKEQEGSADKFVKKLNKDYLGFRNKKSPVKVVPYDAGQKGFGY